MPATFTSPSTTRAPAQAGIIEEQGAAVTVASVPVASAPVTETAGRESSRHFPGVAAYGWALALGKHAGVSEASGRSPSAGPTNPSTSRPGPEAIESLLVLAMSWTPTVESRSAPLPSISWGPETCWPWCCPAGMGSDAIVGETWLGDATIFLKTATCFCFSKILDDLATSEVCPSALLLSPSGTERTR